MKRDLASIGVALLCSVIWSACSSDSGTPSDEGGLPSYQEHVDRAWSHFEAGEFSLARTAFDDAIKSDAMRAEGYVGLGWIELVEEQLDQADSRFTQAEAHDAERTSPTLYAGWSLILNAKKDYVSSNQWAGIALDLDPDWRFEHGLDIGAYDLGVVRAQNFFALSDYQSSLEEVESLDSSFVADVTTDQGVAALAEKIEALANSRG